MAEDVLARIVVARRTRLAACPGGRESGEVTEDDLETKARAAVPARDLRAHLLHGARPAVIAEIKRASPTAGEIAPHADATVVAAAYAGAGAAALSVLTEPEFFQGALADLPRAREGAPGLPLLRKDFLLSRADLLVARALGADSVLLIARLLRGRLLGELIEDAHGLAMEPLVEVHSEGECDAAIDAGARLVGVNHRDLDTFAVDLALTGRLRKRLPADVTVVAESGLRTSDDIRRVTADGADAILVGETFMRQSEPGAALSALLGPVWEARP